MRREKPVHLLWHCFQCACPCSRSFYKRSDFRLLLASSFLVSSTSPTASCKAWTQSERSNRTDREKREMKGERRGRDCFRSPRQEAEPPNKYFGKRGRTSTRKKEKNNKLLVWVVTGATAQRIYLLLRVLCPCLHCSVFFGGSRKCHRDRCRGGIVRKQTQNTQ